MSISYTKTTWVNNQAPAINATNLNKIETGIKNATDAINTQEEELEKRVAKMTLLWTNSSPTSSMSAQSITVSGLSTDYDYFLLIYTVTCSTAQFGYIAYDQIIFPEGTNSIITNGWYYNAYRSISVNVSTKKFAVGNCGLYLTYGSASAGTYNDNLVPAKLYGLTLV